MTSCDLLELLHPSVLKHVAAQVGFSRETTTTAGNCAETRALWAIGNGSTISLQLQVAYRLCTFFF